MPNRGIPSGRELPAEKPRVGALETPGSDIYHRAIILIRIMLATPSPRKGLPAAVPAADRIRPRDLNIGPSFAAGRTKISAFKAK